MRKRHYTLPARIEQAKPIPYRLTQQTAGQVEDLAARFRSSFGHLRDAVSAAAALALYAPSGGQQGRPEQMEAVKRGFELLAEQASAAAVTVGDQLAELARRR